MIYKPKVYTASKLLYHKYWAQLREDPDWDFVEWTASWVINPDVFAEVNGEQPSAVTYRDGWIADIKEVKESDFVLLYGKPSDALKGALVEAGVALGLGITVVVVGIGQEHTWTYHPNVYCFPSIREARQYLYRFVTMAPPTRRKKGRPANDE